ncbi:MAG: DinB family protein [Gemmatimonadaceae bacterium]
MRRTVLILLAIATPAFAQEQQSAMPAAAAVGSARAVWMVPHGFVARALEQVPDSLLAFKPTPDVRSLGQLFAHVADGERLFCALAMGEPAPNPFDVTEKTKKTKAELVQALKESAAYCDKAYAQTDAAAQTPAEFFGNKANRLFLLNMNGAHDYEHYGNIVTYMRLKGMTPPSSQR